MGVGQAVDLFGSFYIASSRDRLDEAKELAARLERRGMRNAFAWWEHLTHRCSRETCGISDRAALARRELAAAGLCDLFIGIARLGKGAHVELGAALGGDSRRVILVGVERADSVFYDHLRVEHARDRFELLRLLELEAARSES